MKKGITLLLFFTSTIFGEPSYEELKTLFNKLDPHSVAELFAFYDLYPNTPFGQAALCQTWDLFNLHRDDKIQMSESLILPSIDIQSLISFVNREPYQDLVTLSDEQLSLVEEISDHLHNRKLEGYRCKTVEECLKLPEEKFDLARALLLHQFEEDLQKVRAYEAGLDLMALQILARLKPGASDEEKIKAISQFIFHEKRYRFPPHSLWAKDVDLYTFLPSVFDSRQGVCLGVSILYLALAQRINVPLEIITPPGHIYIRYHNEEGIINIETTARGIHVPSEAYLGINTRKLQERNIKEVVGLAFINQAAVAWHQSDHEKAIELYKNAELYLPHDPLLKMFLGYNYLLAGHKKEGTEYLKQIENVAFEERVYKDTMTEDYLKGRVSAEGINIVFSRVNEKRSSILQKQKEIKTYLKKHPKFRDGIMHLAITYLQLGRGLEAYETLQKYHRLDPNNPTVEYYLAILGLERYCYPKAWKHLEAAEAITRKRDHFPKCLVGLRHALRAEYPQAMN